MKISLWGGHFRSCLWHLACRRSWHFAEEIRNFIEGRVLVMVLIDCLVQVLWGQGIYAGYHLPSWDR